MEKDEEEPKSEDVICEENYIQTTTRDSADRLFVVVIPFKNVFMRESLEMGHMNEVGNMGQCKFDLPHQPVIRKERITTKLRVVFHALAKTTNEYSLNDMMLIAPRLLRDIVDIIVNCPMIRNTSELYREKIRRRKII